LALDDKRDKVYGKLANAQFSKWTPELSFKKGDIVLVKRRQTLKILSPWYSTPYMIYHAYDLYHDGTNIYAHFQ
jgi:hypothetical protein